MAAIFLLWPLLLLPVAAPLAALNVARLILSLIHSPLKLFRGILPYSERADADGVSGLQTIGPTDSQAKGRDST